MGSQRAYRVRLYSILQSCTYLSYMVFAILLVSIGISIEVFQLGGSIKVVIRCT